MPDKAKTRLMEFLSDNRGHYKEIRSKLEDPDRVLRLLNDIYRWMEPVLSVDQKSQPHEAMFAIGATKAGIEVVFEEIAFYQDYQEKQGQLAHMTELSNDGGGENQVMEHTADHDVTISAVAT